MFKSLAAIVLLLGCLRATAQPGIKDSIYSSIIGEERRLQIQLPPDYKPGSTTKYQVLYLLDGEWNAELFQQAETWQRQWGYTPPIIMVGVVNSYPNGQNQRFRDLTPTSAGQKNAGGGPKLLSFLKNELIPYINSHYPSSGTNILWGHSLGGLFVLYSMLTEPQLFESYIAADPSLWWDNKFLLHYAAGRLRDIRQIKSLLITGRTGVPYHEMGIDSFGMLLERAAPPELEWRIVTYPDETHISMQGKSAYDGLKYTFAPLFQQDAIHVDPMEGTIVKGEPFTLQCYNIMADKYLRYTVDGTDPTLASGKLREENQIDLTSDHGVTIKSFFPGDSADKRLALAFKLGGWMKATGKPKEAVSGGWNYAWHRTDGAGQAGADTTIKKGIAGEGFHPNRLDTNAYACQTTGWLEVLEKGYYVIEMNGAPGTKLVVDDRPLMEIAAGKDYDSYIMPLDKGAHSIRFEFTHEKGGKDFDVSYKPPGQPGDGGLPIPQMYYLP